MSDAFYQNLALWSQVGGSALFFVIVIALWRRFLGPAVVAATQRKNEELAESERRRDEAKDQVEEAQRKLASAADDVRAIRQRAERDAAAERERLVKEATAEGERLVRNAGGELERLRRAGRETLRDELVQRALEIAREAATKVDGSTDRRLLDESLSVLEGGSSR